METREQHFGSRVKDFAEHQLDTHARDDRAVLRRPFAEREPPASHHRFDLRLLNAHQIGRRGISAYATAWATTALLHFTD